MTTLRTANRRKARSLRRYVLARAYLEWLDRATRLAAAGREDKFKHSGFIRRMVRREKARRAREQSKC